MMEPPRNFLFRDDVIKQNRLATGPHIQPTPTYLLLLRFLFFYVFSVGMAGSGDTVLVTGKRIRACVYIRRARPEADI